MSKTTTFTTLAGHIYAYTVETLENGEAAYDLTRVFADGAEFPVGAIVVHPNWELFPGVEGLLNIQFGKGSTDRHERTDVPMIGGGETPYVVGSHLVNPADLTTDTEDESAPRLKFRKTMLAAHFQTGSPAESADKETFERVQDLITALVQVYQADKATPQRETTYAKFLNGQRADAVQKNIHAADAKIKALTMIKAELAEKLNAYKAAA
ncbi:hypothetical protein OG369_43305 [Streptomyces sp. NBC_01221]|uniref:hypothetical protein n=1 Tax=Streptomyces sp. NBC_01221 TaxID=2903782 RepID=UPI0022597B13|nr:hypothetical protein [Streptomyces sp. NBC_01221]MCX4792606.1 hypothetical protein [Streptomyces sp. NBC_01221]